MSLPNSASLASFTASVPALESPFSFGYLRRTSATGINLLFLISEDGSAFDAALIGNGFLVGVLLTCRMELVGVVGVGGMSLDRGCEHRVVGVTGPEGMLVSGGCEHREVGVKGAENGCNVEAVGVQGCCWPGPYGYHCCGVINCSTKDNFCKMSC